MIARLIYSILLFCLSFSILCIPLSGRPLFYHLKNIVSPIAEKAYEKGSEAAQTGTAEAKKWGTKLFTNSLPAPSKRNRVSSVKAELEEGEELDAYSDEDQKRLTEIIESADQIK